MAPAFGKLLNGRKSADVPTWIRDNWRDAAAPVSEDAATAARESLQHGP